MATTKNSNLFYQLYSTPNDVAASGYKCSSAVDENDTSFDVDDGAATITDSNGNVLASVDLESIHSDGLTQYNTETKILQPHSAYLLQGSEYGETYCQQWFEICEEIYSKENYIEYCNISFDILYRNKCKGKSKLANVRIDTKKQRTSYGSFIQIALAMIDMLKIPASVSVYTEEIESCCNKSVDYIKFQGTEEGYEFIVRNVIITPIMCDDSNADGSEGNYYDSPFTGPNMDMEWLTTLFEKHRPRLLDDSNKEENNNSKYTIDCGIFKEFIEIANDIQDDFNTFVYELLILRNEFLPLFRSDGKCYSPYELAKLREKYPNIYYTYFGSDTELSKYNIYDIVDMLNEIEQYMYDSMIGGPHTCYENLSKRMGPMKYPNGAMRGIVLVPDWPDTDDEEISVLWVNHVAERIEVNSPVDIGTLRKYFGADLNPKHRTVLFEKAIATVKVNALIPSEKEEYIEDEDALPLDDISSNDGFTNSFDYLQEVGLDSRQFVDNEFHRGGKSIVYTDRWNDNHIAYFEPDIYLDDNQDDKDVWETRPNLFKRKCKDSHLDLKKILIGLYKYMQYLKDNDLWLRVGDAYMIVGKKDDGQSLIRNLLPSLLVYNPNDYPVRIKYMIFS